MPLIVYQVPGTFVWCCSIFSPALFIYLLCNMYPISGLSGSVDIELSVRAWYQKKDSTCAAAREVYSAAAASCSKEGRCAVCGITFKIACKTK